MVPILGFAEVRYYALSETRAQVGGARRRLADLLRQSLQHSNIPSFETQRF